MLEVNNVFVLRMMCLIPVGAIMISVVFALAPDAHILLSGRPEKWEAAPPGHLPSLRLAPYGWLGREWSQNWQIVGHKRKALCSVWGQLGFFSRVQDAGCNK